MRCAYAILGLGALGLASPLVFGQTPNTLLVDGDPIIGIGGVEKVNYLAITDSRMWATQVATTFPDNTRDGCMLRSGFLTLREGMPLRTPPGFDAGILDEFNTACLSNTGNLAILVKVKIPTSVPLVDGAYWNLTPLAIKGSGVSGQGLGPGTTWDKMLAIKITPDNHVYVIGQVNNPVFPPPAKSDALIRYTISPQGTITETTVIATRGQFVDELGTAIANVGSPTAADPGLCITAHGDFIACVTGLAQAAVLMKNLDTVLATDETPSPSPGRVWTKGACALAKVAINERGDTAFAAPLKEVVNNDTTNFLVVKNGKKFAQAGDSIPALSSAVLGKGTPLIALSNAGDLFWRAVALQGGVFVDDAFMRNYTPIIQKNKTLIGGNAVTSLNSDDTAFAISPEGRFFAGRVVIQQLGDAILYVDFGLILERLGCLGVNPGKLLHISGDARLGKQFQLGLTDGPGPGALTVLLFSRQGRISASGCGVSTSYGELMVAPPIAKTLILAPWDGVNPSVVTVAIPNNIALVDAVFYAQGIFRSTTQPATYSMTNAMQIEIGPP